MAMRERAELLGGELFIDSAPGKGTRITVRIPMISRKGA
jgi:signal transduction histidine kinase